MAAVCCSILRYCVSVCGEVLNSYYSIATDRNNRDTNYFLLLFYKLKDRRTDCFYIHFN